MISPKTDAMEMDSKEDGSVGSVLTSLSKKVKDMKPTASVANEHKEFHAVLSKLGKAIDKVTLQTRTI